MRLLLLTHAFNSLAQRLFVELRERGHDVSVELDIADAVTLEAIELFTPDLVIAPFLKRAIPAAAWKAVPCLVVHPGIVGDRGPSSLDWAVLDAEADWGVTVLQANAEMDAGDVWAEVRFPMHGVRKSGLYRHEVAAAAIDAVLLAVQRQGMPGWPIAQPPATPAARGRSRPAMRQQDRSLDWATMDTATIVRRCGSADGAPGLRDTLFGRPCWLFDVAPASAALAQRARERMPGAVPGSEAGRRDDAILRLTCDGAVWIGQAKPAWDGAHDGMPFKLPAGILFAAESTALPAYPVALQHDASEYAELRYAQSGDVGTLEFEFYNGAMSTRQCLALRDAVADAMRRPIRVLVLAGGRDFFSNGIHLNVIEAHASPADESMRNIEAMDDLVLQILSATHLLTVSALRGNAGAGGAFLALAADEVWTHPGTVLNLHYKNMGNLYGSEYWTYTLPARVGDSRAREIVQERLPIGARRALAEGLVDALIESADAAAVSIDAAIATRAAQLAADPSYERRLAAKSSRRARDEAARPLARYRDDELARIRRNFYGFDPSYHVARYHFVRKLPHAWTPRHLAVHREAGAGRLRAAAPA
ncbi:MAG TPA: enoyl-CoA hydratase-related protein [Burkholderiaceae bacterium]|nr:enoyl-CoA hydratase-related protein [Burkholderiaceae bacterium]